MCLEEVARPEPCVLDPLSGEHLARFCQAWRRDTVGVEEPASKGRSIPNRTMRDGLVLGTILLVIHSFVFFLAFLYCHINTESQVVFVYFLFFVVDAPIVPLAFEIEGKTGLLVSLTDSWTDLWYYGHQGVNLRAFILTAVFGGLHWFVVGNLLSDVVRRIQQRLPLKRQPV